MSRAERQMTATANFAMQLGDGVIAPRLSDLLGKASELLVEGACQFRATGRGSLAISAKDLAMAFSFANLFLRDSLETLELGLRLALLSGERVDLLEQHE